VHIFRNIKLILIRKIFRSNVYKMSNKSTIKTTTRIANIYRITFDNNNILIMRFRDSCQLTQKAK